MFEVTQGNDSRERAHAQRLQKNRSGLTAPMPVEVVHGFVVHIFFEQLAKFNIFFFFRKSVGT